MFPVPVVVFPPVLVAALSLWLRSRSTAPAMVGKKPARLWVTMAWAWR